MLLTVYVDGLLLSGPRENHHKVWARIGKAINIEEPELLDRFLGRTHTVTELPKVSSAKL